MLSSIQERICEIQGELFQLAAEQKYDMHDFVQKYLSSHFANKEMDADYSFYHFADSGECLDNLLREMELKQNEDEIINPAMAYWIGYTLRQIGINFRVASEQLKFINLEKLMLFSVLSDHEEEEYFLESINKNLLHFPEKEKRREIKTENKDIVASANHRKRIFTIKRRS